jgi:hypothetical protein
MTRRPREPAFLLIPVPLEEILTGTPDSTPAAVLVHGAFVDAPSWNGVITELTAAGLDVVAPPNLLRGAGVGAACLTGFA